MCWVGLIRALGPYRQSTGLPDGEGIAGQKPDCRKGGSGFLFLFITAALNREPYN